MESPANEHQVDKFLLISKISNYVYDDNDVDRMQIQDQILKEKESQCMQDILNDLLDPMRENDDRCPRFWDGILCWPSAPHSSHQLLPCPEYIVGFNTHGFASKICTENGSWYFNEEVNHTWTNYSHCITNDFVNSGVDFVDQSNSTLIVQWLPVIKRISRAGYGVSLITLAVALFILASLKKLRCPRNTLHLHLFISFIMRAFMSLLKDNLFVDGIGIGQHTFNHRDEVFYNHGSWYCKVVTCLWQYFIMANYSWILMEGLYLHNLIFLALFTDSSAITVYIYLGWGLPMIFVTPWVLLRVFYEDLLCWTTNNNVYIFWLIRGPITVSVIVNFIFFVHVTWVILLKLRSSVSADTRKYRYRKWAKSTLILVPLFGVHYTVFGGMQGAMGLNETVEVIWLFCDQLFACFQGFFVAVLYCFVNGEVRGEVTRHWKHWRQTRSANGSVWQHPANNSRTNGSRWRTSFLSLGTSVDRRDARVGSLTPSPVGGPSHRTNRLLVPHVLNASHSSRLSSYESRLEKIASESEEHGANRGPCVDQTNALAEMTLLSSMKTVECDAVASTNC